MLITFAITTPPWRRRCVKHRVESLAVVSALTAAQGLGVAGLTARVQRDGQTYDVALADLTFDADSQLGRIVAAYRRWQGRTP